MAAYVLRMNYYKSTTRTPFLVSFAYHSKEFFGVQEQRGLKTVLGALRKRIEVASAQEARALVVAARTDKGVSALQNYASFYLRPPVDMAVFIAALTDPQDDGLISVSVHPASINTHARNVASQKTYCYTIKDNSASSVTEDYSGFVWNITPTLSLMAMRFAALDMLGEQDFSSLRGGGCQAGSAVKRVTAIDIHRNSAGYILMEISGTGFLRKMVRNMVGLLVEIGAHLRPCDVVAPILAERDREAAGIMAPAHGLMLRELRQSLF